MSFVIFIAIIVLIYKVDIYGEHIVDLLIDIKHGDKD